AGGDGSDQPAVEAEAQPEPSSIPPDSPRSAAATQPPKLPEVQAAVKRMYGKAVVIDEKHQPCFITGDFNGDSRQDLAVVVKPASGMLDEVNSEVANWTIQDPLKAQLLDPKNLMRRAPAKPTKVYV